MPPKPARLRRSQVWASNNSGGASVSRATVSGLRPVVRRRILATCAAAGKQTPSGVVGAVQRMRSSSRLRLRSWVQARVLVDSRGGEGCRNFRQQLFYRLVNAGLIVFDRQRVMGPMLLH